MKKPALVWIMLVLAAFVVGAVGCSTQQTSAPPAAPAQETKAPASAEPAKPAPAQPAPAKPPAKVRVGVSVQTLVWAPLYIAAHAGLDKKHGVELELINTGGGPNLSAAFLGGDVDLAASAFNSSIELKSAGKDAIAVYAFEKEQTQFVAVSNRYVQKNNIDLKAPFEQRIKKLKGITLGAPSLGGTTEQFTRWIMRRGGLTDNDVAVIKVGSGSAQIAAMEQGQIDGFVASPATPQEAVQRGAGVILVYPGEIPEFKNYIHVGNFASMKWSEANADTLRRVNASFEEAKQMLHGNFDAAVAALQKEFPKYDPKILAASTKDLVPAIGTDGKMTEAAWDNTLKLVASVTQDKFPMDAKEGFYWTNKFIP